jgi:hypothetical protein
MKPPPGQYCEQQSVCLVDTSCVREGVQRAIRMQERKVVCHELYRGNNIRTALRMDLTTKRAKLRNVSQMQNHKKEPVFDSNGLLSLSAIFDCPPDKPAFSQPQFGRSAGNSDFFWGTRQTCHRGKLQSRALSALACRAAVRSTTWTSEMTSWENLVVRGTISRNQI